LPKLIDTNFINFSQGYICEKAEDIKWAKKRVERIDIKLLHVTSAITWTGMWLSS